MAPIPANHGASFVSQPYTGLYSELWKASAGPLVDVPRRGERVFYFPQGHLEQLEASINLELNQKIPFCDLPSKILCRVVDIQLMAEKETDEAYAQVTLLPELDQSEASSPEPDPVEHPRRSVHSFRKILTASDTSTMADSQFYDMSQPTPTQELLAKDLHGYEWKFKHIYRGQPRRDLLTTGWSTFVTSKRLLAGDAFVFLRGDNGEMRVGVRRLARQQAPMPSSLISSHSMHLGVLATASHAFRTQTRFVVYYKPRTSQFIIGFNKYLDSIKIVFSIGMRFKMQFRGRRIFGEKIVNALDQILGNNCRCRRRLSSVVQWDEPSTIPRPEGVSSWEIEHFALQPMTKSKRVRPVEILASELTSRSSLFNDTPVYGSPAEHTPSAQCRLFGIDLLKKSKDTSNMEKPQPSKKGNNSKGRIRTKVQMQGCGVGRAVDLAALQGYEQLIDELDNIFDIKGELLLQDKWVVVFTDNENDMMLVGDDPWPEFCKMARKIYIFLSEEVKKMGSKPKHPPSSVTSLDSHQ